MRSLARPWLVVALSALIAVSGARAVASPATEVPPPSEPADSANAEAATAAAALDEVDPVGRAEPEVEAPATVDGALALGAADVSIAVADETGAAGADQLIVGLTAPLDVTTHDVVVIGASWLLSSAVVSVDLRVLWGEEWGDWETLEVDDESEGVERAGTEPYFLTDGDDVQVRLMTDDGSTPRDARLDVYGVDVTSEDVRSSQRVSGFGTAIPIAASGTLAETTPSASAGRLPASTNTPAPTIRSRSAWGAVAPSGDMNMGVVRGVTLHHTAGSNDYTSADVPAILRGIQNYHMQSRGWSDIGYNFLVDRYGGIWEGRSGGILNTQAGVHASSFNGYTSGVSVMGNFDGSATVTTAIKNALASLIAWKLALHGVHVGGVMSINGRTYPTIVGHKDVPDASTACPGSNLYAFLPTLRIMAAQRQLFPRSPIHHDLDLDGAPDAAVLSGAGRVYTGTDEQLSSAVQIGTGWNVMDLIVGTPSMRGTSAVDLVYRESLTGRLSVYHGDGHGGFTGKTVWGYGWNAMSAVVGPGDWTGDGRADLIAVNRETGSLYLYRGDGRGGLSSAAEIGHGWLGIRSVMAAGDMNGDGATDLVAIVDDTSELLIYPGNGAGGFKPVINLGGGYEDADVAVGIADLTGDGANDIVVRDAVTGEMTTVAGTGTGGISAINTWGSGWNAKGALVSAANWNGNGQPVLITFDRSTGLLYSYEASRVARFTQANSMGLPTGTTAHVVVGDVTGDGAPSVVTRDAAGDLFLHIGTGTGTFEPPLHVGSKWNGMRQIAAAGDFDGDGIDDLLALSTSGTLYVYPFASDGSGALSADSYTIGVGFADYRVFGVGGWATGSVADVLAINRSTGQLRWFLGHGRGGLTGGTVIGSGWADLDVVALGDLTGSGNNDLLARHMTTGAYSVYTANGHGGFAGVRSVVGVPALAGAQP